MIGGYLLDRASPQCAWCERQLALFELPFAISAMNAAALCAPCVDEMRELDQCARCGAALLDTLFVLTDELDLPNCGNRCPAAHAAYLERWLSEGAST